MMTGEKTFYFGAMDDAHLVSSHVSCRAGLEPVSNIAQTLLTVNIYVQHVLQCVYCWHFL